LDGQALIEHLQFMFQKQVFMVDQKWAVAFQGYLLLCKVLALEVIDTKSLLNQESEDDDIKEVVQMGMMLKTTGVNLSKNPKSSLRFINLPNTKKNVFKAGSLNFEELGIGGLDKEFSSIFRRAFASRVLPSDVVKKLGIKHVKGILLYGPPGTGKTLIARQIGKMLNCREPKIVNGPEILNKYVGQSEENIRNLFVDAEEEQEEKQDESELHLIIFDEIDAICKQRGTVRSGTGVNDSVVNQLLSKIDGVNSLNNILIIGMTNRLDLIDEALMRPGRFEVQMEIGLPDEEGRYQILRIHTKLMRKHEYLDKSVDLKYLAKFTKNFSGAEIEGLVKSATSFACNRKVNVSNIGKDLDLSDLTITMADFEAALKEVKPAFGVSQDDFENYISQGLIDYGTRFKQLLNTCRSFINQVKTSKRTNLLSVLLQGPPGCGKTALAAHLAIKSGIPFIKIISPETMVGYTEHEKVGAITKVFHDAYKSPLSIIVLDNIERLIEYINMGPRFSNVILQALLVLVKKVPPKNRKLCIIGTTAASDVLRDLEIVNAFNIAVDVPELRPYEAKEVLLKTNAFKEGEDVEQALKVLTKDIGIKNLLLAIEMARSRVTGDEETEGHEIITVEEFTQSLRDCGFDNDEYEL
jgi:vesicle-fusing ATPase